MWGNNSNDRRSNGLASMAAVRTDSKALAGYTSSNPNKYNTARGYALRGMDEGVAAISGADNSKGSGLQMSLGGRSSIGSLYTSNGDGSGKAAPGVGEEMPPLRVPPSFQLGRGAPKGYNVGGGGEGMMHNSNNILGSTFENNNSNGSSSHHHHHQQQQQQLDNMSVGSSSSLSVHRRQHRSSHRSHGGATHQKRRHKKAAAAASYDVTGVSGQITSSDLQSNGSIGGGGLDDHSIAHSGFPTINSNNSTGNGNSHHHYNGSNMAAGAALVNRNGFKGTNTNVLPLATIPRDALPMYSEEHQLSSVTSIKGLKPNNPAWLNQDNFFVIEGMKIGNESSSGDNNLSYYCVLDGHGEHGHHISRKCRENFLSHIKSSGYDIKRAFAAMQNDLNNCEYDARCSGATCVLATLHQGRLSVANCGDSRAVLGRRNPNGSMSAHALTTDHKPDKPEERKRILACGGHLGCRQMLVNQPGRGPVSMPVGPCRVWYQYRGETLGLAMSRSLGDAIVHKSGVSAEPEILDHMVDEYDEFMIIATDGVWDVVDNNQAVQMVNNFVSKNPSQWTALDASNCVCKFARSRWEKLSPMVDDITCIVVKLKNR